MTSAFLVLAQSMFPWYSWVGLIGIVVIIVAYKMYQKKMMS